MQIHSLIENPVAKTTADFYIGRGPTAQWLGSLVEGGAPDTLPLSIQKASSRHDFEDAVSAYLDGKGRAKSAGYCWNWGYPTSLNTTFTYAFDGGALFMSSFGENWMRREDFAPDDIASPVKWAHTGDGYDVPNMFASIESQGLDAALLYEAALLGMDVARFGGLASVAAHLLIRAWTLLWCVVMVPGSKVVGLVDSEVTHRARGELYQLLSVVARDKYRSLLRDDKDEVRRDFATLVRRFCDLRRAALFWTDTTMEFELPLAGGEAGAQVRAHRLIDPSHLATLVHLASDSLAFACDVPITTFRAHCRRLGIADAGMPDDLTIGVLARTAKGRATLWSGLDDPWNDFRFYF